MISEHVLLATLVSMMDTANIKAPALNANAQQALLVVNVNKTKDLAQLPNHAKMKHNACTKGQGIPVNAPQVSPGQTARRIIDHALSKAPARMVLNANMNWPAIHASAQ